MKTLAALSLLFARVLTAQQPPGKLPPGKLIDMGGHRLHLNCTGTGSPAVMIVGGGFSFDWILVQTEVAKFTRVCTWDPAGTAFSDPNPGSGPDCTSRVDELHNLLARAEVKAEVKGPWVLVGLSVGALVARLYTRDYPADVAALVIVDHAFIDTGSEPRPARPVDGPDSPPSILEMTPIVITAEDDPGFANLPEAVKTLHRWAASLNPVLPSVETARDCIARLGAASIHDLPLAVVSTANESPGYPRLQAQLLALSRNSKQFIADRSFHSIEMSQPDVIVAAIHWVSRYTPAQR
jgi:pimeloyl-ACP methyl ester carboxylesterase